MLNKALRRLGKPVLGNSYQLLATYTGKPIDVGNREHIVEQVGDGTLTVNNVIRTLFSEDDLLGKRVERKSHKPKVDPSGKTGQVLVTGEGDVPTVLSACCKPRFPHEIIGFVTRGSTIRVHRAQCRELEGLEQERILEASWAAAEGETQYQVKLVLETEDRKGLLKDVVTIVSDLGMSILDFSLKNEGKSHLMVETPNYDLLDRLMYRLERVDGVRGVEKG